MKKLLTTIFIFALTLVYVFAQPVLIHAAAENKVTDSSATILSSSDSGDIDVPFDPVKKVRRIWIATRPVKVVYRFGEDLDISGMVVKATYSDGSSTSVINYTVSGYSASIIGEQTITVTFGGKKATFIVTVDSPDYTYTVENGESTITGYSGAGGDISIPCTLGGYPVTTIGYGAFYGCDNLTGVTFPDSVASISDSAFDDCDSLSAVVYPGTKCQWEKVSVGTSNDDLLNADLTYTEGEHSYGDYVDNNDATCTTDGTQSAKCNYCEETDTRTVEETSLGHSFTNYVSNNDATYDADGTKTAKCDRCEETDTVTDEGSKRIRNGWHNVDGEWYYYQNNAKHTGWLKDAGTWYYLNGDGMMLTNWQVVGGKWYYFAPSGAMQTGWLQQGSIWYYLDNSGAMATGWKNVGGTYYYFNTSGVMQTGWLKEGNTWYYLRSSGAMATGWAQISGKWYYFNASGAMLTGWQKISNVWYYFQSGGAMQTGWLKLGSTWYYFHGSGAMATGPVKIGTKTYNFNASGACLNP